MIHKVTILSLLVSIVFLKEATKLKYVDYGFANWNFGNIFHFEENQSQLHVKAPNEGFYPCQLGKYLGWLANDTVLRLEEQIDQIRRVNQTYEVVFDIPQDSQFIIFQLGLPFPAPFGLSYYANQDQRGRNYYKQIYLNDVGALTIFQKVATESQNDTHEEDLTLGKEDFGKSVYVFPEEAKDLFAVRIQRAHISVDSLMGWMPPLQRDLLKRQILEYTTSTSKFVIFDENLHFKDPKGRMKEEVEAYIPHKKFQEDIHLKYGDVLFSWTDESFQLWLSKDEKSAYVVDCGSLFLSGGLQQLTNQAKHVENIYMTITHYHIEHMQTMVSFIKYSPQATFHLYVSQATSLAFAGWYIQHFTTLEPLIKARKLKIYIAEKDTYLPFGDYQILFLYPWIYQPEFRHFVPNVAPLVKLDDDRYFIFGGDLEDYSDDKNQLEKLIGDWLEKSFKIGKVTDKAKRIDFFFYIGLLSHQVYLYPHLQAGQESTLIMPEDLVAGLEHRFASKNLQVIQAHIKDAGYGMSLLETRDGDEQQTREEL